MLMHFLTYQYCMSAYHIYSCVAGWFCQSEKKRFRQADHRSYAAEGVPAPSSEQGSHWRASQSSSCSDKYLHHIIIVTSGKGGRGSWHSCLSVRKVTWKVLNLALYVSLYHYCLLKHYSTGEVTKSCLAEASSLSAFLVAIFIDCGHIYRCD